MAISEKEREILRRLAEEQAKIAALPVHKEKAELWRRLNDLERVRPLVWINELPWNEMNVDGELTLATSDPWARELETGLRQLLYQWRHLPADMIVDDFIACPLVIDSTGFGFSDEFNTRASDETNVIVSKHFHPQITKPEDIEKIKTPQVTFDQNATEENYQKLCDLFGDILPVRKVGKYKGTRFNPWDKLVKWWGVQEALLDLVERPEMASAAIARMVDAYLGELDQWDALNLLTRNDNNTRIGSGGFGYTSQLPSKTHDPSHVHPRDMWGSATAQIFVSVSPKMHWEFAVKHEIRWLERWGLNYYGCCEPLDTKMDLMRRIPNLRKVSMSPWVDVERAVKAVGRDYVFSRKPSPAIFAGETWSAEQTRSELQGFLEKARGCNVEIIMKDISTVRYQPQRLWEWENITMDLVEKLAP